MAGARRAALGVATAAHLALGTVLVIDCTSSVIAPSPMTIRSPTVGCRRSSGLVVDADHVAVLASTPVTTVTIEPGDQFDAAAGERRGAHLRPGQIGEHGHDRPVRCRRLADRVQAADVIVERAVAEVESNDVDTGQQQLSSTCGRSVAGPSVATIFVRAFIPGYLVTHGVVVGAARAAASS